MNADMMDQLKRSQRVMQKQIMLNQTQLTPLSVQQQKFSLKKTLIKGMDIAKTVLFENLSLEERNTLKRKAKKSKNVYADSFEARQARETFEALYLAEADVTKLYNIFNKICILVDPGIDDRISYGDFLQFLDIDHSDFHLRFYRNYDTGHRNQIDFKTFVTATWTYCTLSEGSLITFCFDLYDVHSAGLVYEDEMITLIEDVFGPDYKQKPKAVKVLEVLDKMCQETVGGFAVSIDMFTDFVRHRAPMLVMPAFEMQRRMRERVMGDAFWRKVSRMRVAKSGGFKNNGINRKHMDVDMLMKAQVDQGFAVKLSEDPYLRTQAKVSNILTVAGSKNKRHEEHVKALKELRAANRWRRLMRAYLRQPPKVGGQKGGRQVTVAPEIDKYKVFKTKILFTAGLIKTQNPDKLRWDHGMLKHESMESPRLSSHDVDTSRKVTFKNDAISSRRKTADPGSSYPPVSPLQISRPHTAEPGSSHLALVPIHSDQSQAFKRTVKRGHWNGKHKRSISPIQGSEGFPAAPAVSVTKNIPKPKKAAASGWIPKNNRPPKSVKLGTGRPKTASQLQPYLGKPSAWSRPATAPQSQQEFNSTRLGVNKGTARGKMNETWSGGQTMESHRSSQHEIHLRSSRLPEIPSAPIS